jgi:uncharacterized protein YkwD
MNHRMLPPEILRVAARRRARRVALLVALLPVTSAPVTVCAGAVDDANVIRFTGCETHAGIADALRHRRELDTAASALARGEALRDAIARSGYRAVETASVHLAGSTAAGAVRSALASRLCRPLTDRSFRDVGSFSSGSGVWVIVAREFVPPSPRDTPGIEREVLARVNAARANGRRCGAERYPPAPPLEPSAALERVAFEHSSDMAVHAQFEHSGHDGSTPAERVRRSGYGARLVGENIAYGSLDAEEAVDGWLASPGHCANIMDPRFQTTGIAIAEDRHGGAGLYWTQVFVAR